MILITGATGLVGRSLTRALEQQDRPFQIYEGRINEPSRLREALEGVDTVYHLATAAARGRPSLLQHVDVEGTQRLLEESKRAGIGHIITLSPIGADPNVIYPLLRARGDVEQQLQRSGLSYTIVRSTSLFGIEDRFLNLIAGLAAWSWPFIWLPGGGTSVFQPLWVEDLARCLLLVLERPGLRNRTLTVAGEERFYYRELADLVTRVAGLKRIPLKVDLRLVRMSARLLMGRGRYPPVTPFFLNRLSVPDVAPVDSLLRTFGVRPARLEDHIAYLRRPGHWRRLFGH